MKLPTNKRELAQALLDGRRFKNPNGETLRFKEWEGYRPFRAGDTSPVDMWVNISRLTEIKEWYDDIPEEGILCWVWDDNFSCKSSHSVVGRYHNDPYPYNTGGSRYKNAIPVKPEECYQGGE